MIVRIALDAMGGDNAPQGVVAGGVGAVVADPELELLLVGRASDVRRALAQPGADLKASQRERITIVDATEVVAMDEHPATAVRGKKDSSIAVGARLVAEGRAGALVSAGNSGAVMAAAIFIIKRLDGVDRPAIGTALPARNGPVLLIDAGANADARPEHLSHFALLGEAYARRVLGVDRPRVGLLSNGEEEGKGNELTLKAYSLLKALPLDFIGNVEGKLLLENAADVVVTDGFTGNIVLKTLEGTAAFVQDTIKAEAKKSPLGIAGGLLLKPTIGNIKARSDWRKIGGAPLLGVKGVVIIAHGRSDAEATSNAVLRGAEAVRLGLVQVMAEAISPSPGNMRVRHEVVAVSAQEA